MRTKEEVLKAAPSIDIGGIGTMRLVLEALLDIRDLLVRLANPPVLVEKSAVSAYDELLAIDDALDLAGAPQADTRVGRIRKWAEKEIVPTLDEIQKLRTELAVTDKLLAERNLLLEMDELHCKAHGKGCVPGAMERVRELAGTVPEPKAGPGVLGAGDTYGPLSDISYEHQKRVECAVLRRVAEMAKTQSEANSHVDVTFALLKFSNFLRRRAGDEP